MAVRLQHPAPVMHGAARLQREHRGRVAGDEGLEPRASEIAPEHRTVRFVNAVHGEDGLGRVDRYALV